MHPVSASLRGANGLMLRHTASLVRAVWLDSFAVPTPVFRIAIPLAEFILSEANGLGDETQTVEIVE